MGLLVEGHPLTSEELRTKLRYIREHGVRQFLNTWRRLKDLQNDELKFGDEIECGIFAVDSVNKTVKIALRGVEVSFFPISYSCLLIICLPQIKSQLNEKEQLHSHEAEGCFWHPEYGAWMVESTPSTPYTGYAADLLRIERNMLLRRRRILSALHENEIAPTVSFYSYTL